MAVDDKSPYLPKSEGRDFVSSLKTGVAYRIWKRKLKQYARFNQNSRFKLLEVGCGAGHFLRCAEKWFPKAEIYGLDLVVYNSLCKIQKWCTLLLKVIKMGRNYPERRIHYEELNTRGL